MPLLHTQHELPLLSLPQGSKMRLKQPLPQQHYHTRHSHAAAECTSHTPSLEQLSLPLTKLFSSKLLLLLHPAWCHTPPAACG
jgi:hypothetical protein